MEVSGWFIFAVRCLFEVLVLLKRACTKSDVSKPTCPFPYCLPLAFLRLESDTSSLTRLLVYFWARPPVWFPNKQCSAMCMCVQTCGRIDVFSTQWVCTVHFCLAPCLCVCSSAVTFYTWYAKTRKMPIWSSPPLLLSALLSSSLRPSAHLFKLFLHLLSSLDSVKVLTYSLSPPTYPPRTHYSFLFTLLPFYPWSLTVNFCPECANFLRS